MVVALWNQNLCTMTTLIKIDGDYAEWIRNLSLRFKQSQIKAAIKVNSEMLRFYFSLGADIVNKKAESRWGDGFFKNLSKDLQNELPGVRGFSETNLRYSKYFYLLYNQTLTIHPQVGDKFYNQDFIISPQIGDQLDIFQIPWSHHKYIIDKCKKDTDKALFYVRKTLENNWSRNVLLNFLDTGLYERQGKAISNFKSTLPEVNGDLAQQLIKDPYCFDFARLTERYNEKELKDALIKNIENFLIELGNGFAYMGREYRIEVGYTEMFADMLFYNTHLHCYVVIEIKTKKFEPSFLGQLSGYVSCANHILKRDGDNPTVGLLICKDKDEVMAHYALEGYNNPLGVSEYELSKLFPKDFRSTLPSIEEIEKELGYNGS